MRALDDIFVCLRDLDVLDLIAARIHGYPSRIEENKKPRQSSFSRIMSVNHVLTVPKPKLGEFPTFDSQLPHCLSILNYSGLSKPSWSTDLPHLSAQ